MKWLCFEDTLKSVVIQVIYREALVSIINTDYEYWKNLYRDSNAYKVEKERICTEVIAAIEKRFPQIKNKVQVKDIATPITYNHYTNAWNGAYMGWNSKGALPYTLPKLENSYIAGQWTNPVGGIPTALLSGKDSIIKICKDDNKEFQSCI